MKMKVLILFALAIAVVNGNAQPKKEGPKSPEQRTEKIMGKLNEVLTLTDDQKPKIKIIILKREQKKAELHKKFPNNKEAFKKTNKENVKAAEAELKTVLTAEQAEKLKKHREEMKQKHKDKKAAKMDEDDIDE